MIVRSPIPSRRALLAAVFRREARAWKIRSYIYASSRPGSGPAK